MHRGAGTGATVAFAVGLKGASVLLHTPFYVTSETVPLADTAYLYSTQSSKLCGCGTMSTTKVRIRRHPANGEHVEGARWLHHEVDYARARGSSRQWRTEPQTPTGGSSWEASARVRAR